MIFDRTQMNPAYAQKNNTTGKIIRTDKLAIIAQFQIVTSYNNNNIKTYTSISY